MNELILDRIVKRGSRGKRVRRVQEWLSLNGFGVVVDGQFGPATELAVREFQKERQLSPTGTVRQGTFSELVQPMQRVLDPLPSEPGLGATVVAYARQHLSQNPREIGGQNRGPWVRLYMKGNEGPEWPWCAGFACFVLEQACAAMGQSLPIRPSFSCDSLAASARQRDRFLPGRGLDRSALAPGMLFLNRRTATDWTHVGIVLSVDETLFLTIEGNTNDDGSREGYELCRRIRGYRSKDFIRVE